RREKKRDGRGGRSERETRVAAEEGDAAERGRSTIGVYQKSPLFGSTVSLRSPVKNGYENVSPAYPPKSLPKRASSRRDQRKRIPENERTKGHGTLRRAGAAPPPRRLPLLPSKKSPSSLLPNSAQTRSGATARTSRVFVRIAKPAAAPRTICQRREAGAPRSSTTPRTA